MKSLIGITNNDIFTVRTLIDKFAKKKRLQVLGFEDKLDRAANIIFIPTLALLLRHIKNINRSKATVFLFDDPVKCHYLKGITLLDIEKINPAYRYKFKPLTKALIKKALKIIGPAKIKQQDLKLIPTLLQNSDGGVLAPILDFLYQSPNAVRRQKYAKEIYLWFAGDKNVNVLRKKLQKIGGFGKDDSLEILIKILESNKYIALRKAVSEIWKRRKTDKPITYQKIIEQYKIKSYDIKFLIFNLEKYSVYQDKPTTSIELFDKMKNKGKEKARIYDLAIELKALSGKFQHQDKHFFKKAKLKIKDLSKKEIKILSVRIKVLGFSIKRKKLLLDFLTTL